MDSNEFYRPRLIGLASELEDSKNALTTTGLTHNTKYIKSAQWSPDGTTVLTSSADQYLRAYILPTDLLDPPHPHTLRPYSPHACPEPVNVAIFHPSFSLSDASTCLVLASLCDLPTRLLSPFAPSILASYPLVSPTTEVFTTPNSLLFNPRELNQFFAGSDSCISLFDINRDGQGPITQMRTAYRRVPNSFPSFQNMRGRISTLAVSGDGVLAAGTFGRGVKLYDDYGHGNTIATFHVDNQSSSRGVGIGITQLLFSPCSRYLLIAERRSDGVSVFDIRGDTTKRPLAFLSGRKAKTQQRMSIDLFGSEVWAGGTDGMVRIWEGVGQKEGIVKPNWGLQAHDDVVSSTGLHPSGSVLLTGSGSRHVWPGEEDWECPSGKAGVMDNSLKIWAL